MSTPLAILVVEDSDALRARMVSLLGQSGFRVDSHKRPEKGLAALQRAGASPYAVVICGLFLSGMKGDKFLLAARQASGFSQRILLADAGYIDAMIRAVNTAHLHSCLTVPFTDRDLVNRVNNACRKFWAGMQKRHLTRVTRRQNRKLFQLASALKKMDARHLSRLKERERRIRILGARLPEVHRRLKADSPPDLAFLLEKMQAGPGADQLANHFLSFRKQVCHILEAAALKKGGRLPPLPYDRIRGGRMDTDNKVRDTALRMLPPLFRLLDQNLRAGMDLFGPGFEDGMQTRFCMAVSPDRLVVTLRHREKSGPRVSVLAVLHWMARQGITRGVASETAIRDWLEGEGSKGAELVVARGRTPVPPKEGTIHCYFAFDHRLPGKLQPDGSMDFADRGEIPFVTKDTLLATLIMPKPGTAGWDVYGCTLGVKDPEPCIFEAGPGARLSKSGTRIYADTDGQPLTDPLGSICVCPELAIEGDLGFETGDVVFDGHVRVSGRVKEGFRIQATSLTAREVQGAAIDLDGDLNVSLGIVDTEMIDVRGTVRAAFVRNSRINAFGDVMVQREITDSAIRISGALDNSQGTVISSVISANQGMTARHIGTDHAGPCDITVGVDDYARHLEDRLNRQIRKKKQAIEELEAQACHLRTREMDLHSRIAALAHAQEKAQKTLERLQSRMADIRASGDMAVYQRLVRAAFALQKDVDDQTCEIDKAFRDQDQMAQGIRDIQTQVNRITSSEKPLQTRLAQVRAARAKMPSIPQIKVRGRIRSGTRVKGPHTQRVLTASKEHCLFCETRRKKNNRAVYQMEIRSGWDR